MFLLLQCRGYLEDLGLGKQGMGEKVRGNILCPCWASQLWDAEPFANSIDWLICIECSPVWSVVGYFITWQFLGSWWYRWSCSKRQACVKGRKERMCSHNDNDSFHWLIPYYVARPSATCCPWLIPFNPHCNPEVDYYCDFYFEVFEVLSGWVIYQCL